MKRILFAIITVSFVAMAAGMKKPVEKILVAGSGWDSIAIINKSTGIIEWKMALPKACESNCLSITKKGEILFAYGHGARLVDRSGKTIWDYPETHKGAEMHTAKQLPNGNYMLASCDKPMRIIELDKNGKLIKEVAFDLGIENPHSQFRQVTKAKNGNYLIPTFGKSNVFEITAQGELVRTYENIPNPFSLIELKNGNLLVSCGDSHKMIEVDRKTGENKVVISEESIEGIKLQFVASAHRYNNGNVMVSNWSGHARGAAKQPQIVEFDANNKLVWSYDGRPSIKFVSAICSFTE